MTRIEVDTQWIPEKWALMEQLLFKTLNETAIEYVEKYTRADGTLIWRDEWPGMDGADDPYEAFMNLTLLYVLGGDDRLHDLSRNLWDALTWQWTQYGQIDREFNRYYDWMHHGEGYLFHYFFGLANPNVLKDRQRALQFAHMYTGDDEKAQNYDKNLHLIRSPISGSDGPRFTMTKEDWCTHRGILNDYLAPFEDLTNVDFASGKCPWTDEVVYEEIIEKMNERMAKGDVPLNLNATSLIANAYLYTGKQEYKKWVEDYVTVWFERAKANGGIIPDNIGLSGKVGEYNDGKWWGGYYGWRWPHGFMTIIEPIVNGVMNAVMLTGDQSYLDFIRLQIDEIWKRKKQIDGKWQVPNKHFDNGWADYRIPNPLAPVYLWTVSMAEEDIERIERCDLEPWKDVYLPTISGRDHNGRETKHYLANTVSWFNYIRGNNHAYPEQILEANYQLINNQLAKMRSPEGDPHNWDFSDFNEETISSIHIWQDLSPVYFESLIQLTLGGPAHISHGGLQHGRVRYFDGKNKRPGLPRGVSALVSELTDKETVVTIVNTCQMEEKEVIIQAGTFAEHTFETVEYFDQQGQLIGTKQINGIHANIHLKTGSGVKLRFMMNRYTNEPTYAQPWEDARIEDVYLKGRNE